MCTAASLIERSAGPAYLPRASSPTFIIGDHRSGTTLLYRLLAETGVFSFVTACHVIRRSRLASDVAHGRLEEAAASVEELLRARGLVDRGIDGVPVTADLPEEYGFAIDDGPRPRLRPETLPRFLELCRHVQTAGEGRPLLLKNPWDALQFMNVKRVVPDARFVFVHREPLAVVDSQLRAIRSLLGRRNEYVTLLAPWYARLVESPARLFASRRLFGSGLGVRIVERHVARFCDYYVRNAGAVPEGEGVSVRYEDLCADATGTIGRLLEHAGHDPGRAKGLGRLIARREPATLPEVARRAAAFRHRVRRYRASVGYGAES